MSSFNTVEKLLSEKKHAACLMQKKIEKKESTENILLEYGVKKDSGFFKLYTKYFLRFLNSRSGAGEIVDPLPPQGFSAKMAHDYWDVPNNYILFSTGEGEGGYLYNIENDSVWDFQIGQLQQLADGTLPHWDSFYDFMIWYLSDEEDA